MPCSNCSSCLGYTINLMSNIQRERLSPPIVTLLLVHDMQEGNTGERFTVRATMGCWAFHLLRTEDRRSSTGRNKNAILECTLLWTTAVQLLQQHCIIVQILNVEL